MALPGVNIIWHSVRVQGGMDRHVLDLITGFDKRGIPVRAVCRKFDWPDVPESTEIRKIGDITPFQRYNSARFEEKAMSQIRPDWPVIAVSRVTSGPVDLAISGGTHLAHLRDKNKSPGYFDRIEAKNEKTLYENAKVIVTHSVRVKEEILFDCGIDENKIRVMYPPIDTDIFNRSREESRRALRDKLGVPDDKFLLLFPSNNHELKGAPLILEALKGRDDIVFAVAGKKPLNAPNVKNLGFVSDMASLYTAADATVLASAYEAFGLVGPESIACGTPVLFSDKVGAVEVLGEPGCYVFERTVPAFAEALEKAVSGFKQGTLRVADPDKCIRYPYVFDDYLGEIISLIEANRS